MQVWLKSVTPQQLTDVRQGDWVEGIGDILTMSQAEFINSYGRLLIKLQADLDRAKSLMEADNFT